MKNSDDARFARLQLIVGEEGLARLEASSVLVLGLGGVGSSCAEALARAGIGKLMLLDRDTVEASNINRQALAFTSTLGRPKAEVMAQMVRDINPNCQALPLVSYLDPTKLDEQIGSLGQIDYVVDAIDTITQKLALAQFCEAHGLPLISSMGGANKLDPTQLRFANIHKTQGCSMSRIMRKECRQRGIKRLEVLYSSEKEQVIAAQKEAQHGQRPDKGSILGTMSYFPPIMGQMIASLVIRRLAGIEVGMN